MARLFDESTLLIVTLLLIVLYPKQKGVNWQAAAQAVPGRDAKVRIIPPSLTSTECIHDARLTPSFHLCPHT